MNKKNSKFYVYFIKKKSNLKDFKIFLNIKKKYKFFSIVDYIYFFKKNEYIKNKIKILKYLKKNKKQILFSSYKSKIWQKKKIKRFLNSYNVNYNEEIIKIFQCLVFRIYIKKIIKILLIYIYINFKCLH